ncbi:cytochrome b/b6 domain-containing protein [Roseomonas sp. CCTCC AB2023176]|uniref:cytochrome b/b6 domain-containing protein n=1 Tax=Roseomonas sp. CCTCC AB2023176 TaxID=3342640 RepID=UPI0035D9AF01
MAEDSGLIRVRVWDPWIRLVHWAVVLFIPLSWWTAEIGRWDWHFVSGSAVLALLVFRLAWGLVGSDTARFSRFLRSPVEGLRHLAHLGRREPDREIGHNAAGGWMVLVLLAVMLVQAVTGLFSDTGILDRGPLASFVSGAWSDRLTAVHHVTFNLILALAALHVLAVLAYAVLKRQDLVRPMVTGEKRLPAEDLPKAPRLGPAWLALLLLAIAAAGSTAIYRLG